MCRRTELRTGRETLLSERQEANCRDRRLLQTSRLVGKLGELAMVQPFVGQAAACESIGCGTCAIAAYHQEELDQFLGLVGEDELVVYLAPVGKVEEA